MNRDPRVSAWAADYVGPEDDDEPPEPPIDVTPRRGPRKNPTVAAYLAANPSAFTHRDVPRPKPRAPFWKWALELAVATWYLAFIFGCIAAFFGR